MQIWLLFVLDNETALLMQKYSLQERKHPAYRSEESGMKLFAMAGILGEPLQFPPPDFYFGPEPEAIELSSVGSLYSYTVVHMGRDRPPYALAMVDFEPNLRIFGRLVVTEGERPTLGCSVVLDAGTLADGTIDYAFRVVK